MAQAASVPASPATRQPVPSSLVTGRALPARSLAFDAALAAVLAAVCIPLVWLDLTGFDYSKRAQVAIVLALAVPIALRRRFPLVAAALAWGVGLAQLAVGMWLIVPGDALLLVSLYSLSAFGAAWAGAIALAATVLGSAISGFGLLATIYGPASTATSLLTILMSALALAAWALGRARRSIALSRVSQQRADQLTDLDRSRVAQLATAAERARIAREMHDIVAHSLSIVIAQADGGRYSGAKDPAAALTALETISETGRAALADMRRILGVLRTEDADTEMAPQPDEQSLGALVDSVRAAGLRVSLVTLGVERQLPPGTGLALYRICQEALTNAMKHAGPDAKVTVVCQWLPSQISLDIQDDGRGAAAESDGAGQGLTGMRQRAELFGGTLSAGPRPGGGFRVSVTMPTPLAVGASERQPSGAEAPALPSAPMKDSPS